jgi:hypothetical protein
MKNSEERIAELTAHRACGNQEQDTQNGKLAGYCVVCQTIWPCDYAKPSRQIQQELTTLKAKVAELEKDKERLDKLNTIPVGNALAHYPSGMWGIVSKDIPLSATAKLGATSVRDLIDAVEVTAIQNTRQKESGE